MEDDNSKQEGPIGSSKETPSTNPDQGTPECGRPDSGIPEGEGSSPSESSPTASPGQASEPSAEQEQKPPISPRKLAANRLNAKRSTGPRTPQGKAKSARNSYKLGIFAQQIFPPTEQGLKDWGKYKDTVTGFYDHYRPAGVIEELLVDKIVTEAIRFARILGDERCLMGLPGIFSSRAIDKVLRYQSALNRQLSKAIEQLEDVQAKRNAASEPSDGTDPDDAADEPPELAGGPVPAGGQRPSPAASGNGPVTRPVPVESSIQAIAAHPPTTAPGGASSNPAGISNSGLPQTEKYKTNPPNISSGGGDAGTAHKGTAQKYTLADIIDRVASLATPQESNTCPGPKSDSGTKSQAATIPQSPSEETILDCL
jgi:hypothetical protein